jgi:hypothetical protein
MRPSALAVALALLPLLAPRAGAAPPEGGPPPAPTPPETYDNPGLGVAITGPAGWTITPDKEAGHGWQRLCVLADAASGAESVVSVRKARSGTLPEMREATRRLFAEDRTFSVTSTTDVPPRPSRPFPGILVDGTQTVPGTPTPAKDPSAPPVPAAPVVQRFRYLQLLGHGREWLVYTTVRATVWSKVADAVVALENALAVKVESARGEGAFRDEEAGFSCRYPAGYGVRVPDRTQHVVEFAPSGEGPVLGVYRYESADDLDAEAAALVAYYTGDEVGGEAEKKAIELAGRSAYVVRAKGTVDGRLQLFLVAVLKRGSDTTFRLRVAADVEAETAAQAAFDAFLKSFALLNG